MKPWFLFALLLLPAILSCKLAGLVPVTPTPTSTFTPRPTSTSTPTGTLTPSPTPTPTITPTPGAVYEKKVPANVVWYNTRIVVKAGQFMKITAAGTSNISGKKGNDIWHPDGDHGYCPSNCLLPGAGYGTLAGKISRGKPFRVGASFEMIVDADGTLFLAINDNGPYYFDNTGYYRVKIEIW